MGRAAATALACLALVIAGCDATEGGAGGDIDAPVRIYVSAPQSGPRAADGADVADGARLALQHARGGGPDAGLVDLPEAGAVRIEARFLDGAAGGKPMVAAAANARTAAQDSSTGAYIGELASPPTRNSAPILNSAGLAQVSPGAAAVDLTGDSPRFRDSPERYRPTNLVTFARVVPAEDIAARVAREAGSAEQVATVLAPARLPAPGGPRFTDAFTERFGRAPGPYAAYGYEAMALAIGALNRADGSAAGFRDRVVAELLSAVRTDSPIGSYAITDEGTTTLTCVQPIRDGEPLEPRCPSLNEIEAEEGAEE